jgi:hypothetical protein
MNETITLDENPDFVRLERQEYVMSLPLQQWPNLTGILGEANRSMTPAQMVSDWLCEFLCKLSA